MRNIPPQKRGRRNQSTLRTANNRPPKAGSSRAANGRRRMQTRTKAKSQNLTTTIRKRGNVYYMFHKERKRISLKLVFALFLVFLGGIGSAISFAQINEVQRDIFQSRQELNMQRASYILLDADAAERYSNEEIERRARELGLSEPDPSQIVYFYAPLVNYVTITGDIAPPTENYFWRGIADYINGLIDRIFG